jgi:uncharacterized protein involved in outer membrane biogenesis
MTKTAGWVAGCGALLALLVVLALLLLPRFIGVAQFRPRLEALISDAVGYRADIGGEVGLALLPRPRLTTSDVRLANPAGFDDVPFLHIGRIEVRLKPIPLLGGSIVVAQVYVHGLQLFLQRNADGRGNWEDLGDLDDLMPGLQYFLLGAAGVGSDEDRRVTLPGWLPGAPLTIDELIFREASICFSDLDPGSDHGAQKRCEVDRINLLLTGLHFEPPMGGALSGGLRLGGSRVVLAADVRSGNPARLFLDLEIDHIDLDRYLHRRDRKPPTTGALQQPPASRSKDRPCRRAPAPLLGNALVRSLILDVSLSVVELSLKQIVLRDFMLNVSGRRGVFELAPISATLSGGRMKGVCRVDVTGEEPHVGMAFNFEGVQVGPLSRALFGRDVVEGAAAGGVEAVARGDRWQKVVKTMDASGEIAMKEGGVIKGIDLAALLSAADGGVDVAVGPGDGLKTPFAAFEGRFRIDHARLHTPHASLSSPAVGITAAGTADLIAHTLDFRITARNARQAAGINGKKQASKPAEVALGGSFSSPLLIPQTPDSGPE